jgi:hypothetical protein
MPTRFWKLSLLIGVIIYCNTLNAIAINEKNLCSSSSLNTLHCKAVGQIHESTRLAQGDVLFVEMCLHTKKHQKSEIQGIQRIDVSIEDAAYNLIVQKSYLNYSPQVLPGAYTDLSSEVILIKDPDSSFKLKMNSQSKSFQIHFHSTVVDGVCS